MPIDYSTLGKQVAEWQQEYVQHIRENIGEEHAADAERSFRDDPWLALRWFAEDMAKAA